MERRSPLPAVRWALFWLLAAGLAQAQTATSTLTGQVRDESGAAVASAAVSVRNPQTGAVRKATSDAFGRYSVAGLDPGEYELRVELTGFKTVVRSGVGLRVGGTTVADVTLAVGPLAEEVTITLDEDMEEDESVKTSLSRVVGTREIESLPNIGRNFVDFVKLSSGVAPGRENIGGGPFKEPDTGVGAAAAPRLSFGGQQELNTLVQVDGVDNIQTFTGLPRATPSQEAVEEFRILNSTYLSEYGRALGGFVNIVTKSGTNDYRGSAYYYGMDDALASRSLLNPPEADHLQQHQFGGTLGGPLQRDRTFFFLNYEGQQRSESNRFSQVILDNLDRLNAVRSRFGLRPETVDQIRTNDYNEVLLKLDHRANETLNLSARYLFLDSQALNFPGGGGRASPASSASRDNETQDQSLVLSAGAVLSPELFSETRLQWARRSYEFRPLVNEPALEITNLLIMGKTTSDLDFYEETRWQAGTSLLLARGGHRFKVGADVNRLSDDAGWNLFFPARIIFPNLNAFLSFTPAVFWWPVVEGEAHPGFSVPFSQAVPSGWAPDTLFAFDYTTFGFFAQDEWRLTPKWTLNYGLRYDLESYPSRYLSGKDKDNFQPRLGLAYAYSPRGVLRAGFGVFSDRLAGSVGQVFTTAEWSSRGNQPNAPALFPRCFGRARPLPPDHGRGTGRDPGGDHLPHHRPAPGRGSHQPHRQHRLRAHQPLQLPGQRAGPARAGGRPHRFGQLPLRAGARPARPHREPERAADGRAGHGQAAHGRPPVPRAGLLHRDHQPGDVDLPRRHPRAAQALLGRPGLHRRLHALGHPHRRGVDRQPGRLPGGARLLAGGSALAPARAPPRHALLDRPGAEGRAGDRRVEAQLAGDAGERPALHGLRGQRRQRGRQPQLRPGGASGAEHAGGPGLRQRRRARGPRVRAGRTAARRGQPGRVQPLRSRQHPRPQHRLGQHRPRRGAHRELRHAPRRLQPAPGAGGPEAEVLSGLTRRSQLLAVGVCIALNMLDGFNVLVMAFTASEVSAHWRLTGGELGTLLSAGLFGMAAGSLFVAPFADRFGRRTIILGCLGLITLGMLLSALAQRPLELGALRVLTGIGIGGMLASLSVITAEYSSDKWRQTAVALQATGYPVGATVGGSIAALLITRYGWRSLFLFGGLASLLMVPIVRRFVPESGDFLRARPAGGEAAGGTLGGLFTREHGRNTLLIWSAFFLVMFSFYFVLSWTPKLLVAAGLSARQGITGGVLLNLGGIVGGSLFSYLALRRGAKGLTSAYCGAAAGLLVLFGLLGSTLGPAFVVALGIGIFLFGSMVGLYALAPGLYPAPVRATGMGWAIGIGRLGAILAPVTVGVLIDGGWQAPELYYAFAAPLVAAGVVAHGLRPAR